MHSVTYRLTRILLAILIALVIVLLLTIPNARGNEVVSTDAEPNVARSRQIAQHHRALSKSLSVLCNLGSGLRTAQCIMLLEYADAAQSCRHEAFNAIKAILMNHEYQSHASLKTAEEAYEHHRMMFATCFDPN